MINNKIELVVRIENNDYRRIVKGEIIGENEFVLNRVSISNRTRVFKLNSKDGPGYPAKEAQQFADHKIYYGRIFAIHEDNKYYSVWAGKNPENNEALQRIDYLSQDEFEHIVGEKLLESPLQIIDIPSVQISTSQTPSTSEKVPTKVAISYQKKVRNTRCDGLIERTSDLMKEFGYKKAGINNSREVQNALEAVGISVYPNIHNNPYTHLLIMQSDGFLHQKMLARTDLGDPINFVFETLEFALE